MIIKNIRYEWELIRSVSLQLQPHEILIQGDSKKEKSLNHKQSLTPIHLII